MEIHSKMNNISFTYVNSSTKYTFIPVRDLSFQTDFKKKTYYKCHIVYIS